MTIFLDVLGISILIPVMPQLLANPMSPEYILPMGWSPDSGLILLGWLTAVYPLLQFLSTPILGQLSDRYGRKKILGVSLVGTALGYGLFAIGIITKNIPLLFFSRALDGFTGGNLSVAQAVVADITPPEKRTKNFGLIGAVFGIGFVAGPYIGARLATPNISFFGLANTPSWFSAATPFWFAGLLTIVNVALLTLFLPETHQHINKALKLKFNQSMHNIKQAATHPGLRAVFPSIFLYNGGFTFFTTFFQVFLITKLHFTSGNVGDFFAYIGIWIAIAQGVVTPIIAKRFKNYQVLRVSMIATGFSLVILSLVTNTKELLLATPLLSLFNGQTFANTTALVSASADKEIQGEVLGINASVQALAQAIPAILAGYIATIGINTPVIVGATIMILGGILFIAIYRPSQQVLEADADASMMMAH
jgi:DHA1 family tetracycline resistance protein-like MFS transporter